jgi:hypothetical protein
MGELTKIISGGQTGADQAALDAAIFLGIPHGGWLPRGRRTEKGRLPVRYKLKELGSGKYRERTKKNIQDSDGTLIISNAPLTGGSALTEALAIRYDRPCLHINLNFVDRMQADEIIRKWISDNRITTLNVAGPRASGDPEIYRKVFALLIAKPWNSEGK